MEADTYELVIENSTDLNAMAAAGHVVGVTTYALNRIPSSNLAAVLAHELGHHTGCHAWAGLLGYWLLAAGQDRLGRDPGTGQGRTRRRAGLLVRRNRPRVPLHGRLRGVRHHRRLVHHHPPRALPVPARRRGPAR
ncbi:M48 family metalloprotease [Streptomyces sp. NPDC051453]|uniref:M48 family metalloprotease n=1 Tax=Streptomyces sp. NPDC051453 TaxID=3154941 RepID=UPI00343C2A4B